MTSEPGDGVNQTVGGPSSTPPAPDEPAALDREILVAELAEAEAERDAVVAALDQQHRRDRRWRRVRQSLVGFLVVLFSFLLPITFVVAWAHKVALDTDGFEATVGPLVDKPAVTAALGTAVTNQIFTSLDPQQYVAKALPEKASFLAGPITSATKGYVQQAVTTVLQSQQFKTLWKASTRFAHSQLLAVLEGHSNAVKTTNGQVVLDLVPLLNSALQNLQGFVSGVVGRSVTLPTVTSNEVPASACKAIANAINRPLPSTCGQIALFPADKLTEARRAVQLFNRVLVLLLIVTPVVALLAVWISRRRRRTLLQLSAGGVIGLVVARRAVIWLSDELVNSGQLATKEARQAILTQVFHEYFSLSRWLIVGLVLVFAAALVTGPYAWARWLRSAVARWAREGRRLAEVTIGRAGDDATTAWIRSHLDLLRILGVVVAVVLLLVLSVSWIGFLVIAVLLVAYELWLHRLGRSGAGAPPPGPAAPGSGSAGPPEGGVPASEPGAAQAI